MPAKSKSQNRLMQAVANNPKLAKSTKVPVTVARKFVNATASTKGLPEKVRNGKK